MSPEGQQEVVDEAARRDAAGAEQGEDAQDGRGDGEPLGQHGVAEAAQSDGDERGSDADPHASQPKYCV